MTKLNELPLRLNIQFFAEEGDDNPSESNDAASNETETKVDAEQSEERDEAEKAYSADDVNRIVQERLARERKKAEEKAEAERLEEQGEYKDLLEKERAKVRELEEAKALAERKQSIQSKLAAKGLSGEEVAKYAKYVEKLVDSDEEIDGVVDEVYGDFEAVKQAEYQDPSAGFGDKKEPKQKSAEELGREAVRNLRRQVLGTLNRQNKRKEDE